MQSLPHSFLAIEGNIGAGKTTLAKLLSERFDRRLILEQFSDNPFLPYFYKNPERYAFPVELFFMTERHKQLQNELTQTELFSQGVVADYFFVKTLLFAKNNLEDEEYRLFSRLYHVLNAGFTQPDLLVYLHRPVEVLQAQIASRGRAYEQDIADDYLLGIQRSYLQYFRTQKDRPVLVLELEDADFLRDSKVLDWILEQLFDTFPKGYHQRKIEEH
ncbi:MAG: deoxynucleoside kinase [Bacteroidota bacterium]